VRAAETWYDAPEVTTALLKFMQVRGDSNLSMCICMGTQVSGLVRMEPLRILDWSINRPTDRSDSLAG
jgi:hypothetical protein